MSFDTCIAADIAYRDDKRDSTRSGWRQDPWATTSEFLQSFDTTDDNQAWESAWKSDDLDQQSRLQTRLSWLFGMHRDASTLYQGLRNRYIERQTRVSSVLTATQEALRSR